MNAFWELLQICVGTREVLTSVPASQDGWGRLFRAFDVHSMLGVVFPALEKASAQVDVPAVVYLSWERAAEKVRRRSLELRRASGELWRIFRAHGFQSCILKGQALSPLYPCPELRQSTDIDVWVGGARKDVMEFLRNHYTVNETIYLHTEPVMFENIRVEVHFTPSWFSSPRANRRLQKWFAIHATEQFDHYDEDLGASIPTLRFNGVYLLMHLYRHQIYEGISLRQLLDYCLLLRHLDDAGRKKPSEDLYSLGLMRFAGALMHILGTLFLIEESYMPCPPQPLSWETTVKRNQSKEGGSVSNRQRIMRNYCSLRICPEEMIWRPFFGIWHYFWRRKNGY